MAFFSPPPPPLRLNKTVHLCVSVCACASVICASMCDCAITNMLWSFFRLELNMCRDEVSRLPYSQTKTDCSAFLYSLMNRFQPL